MSKRMHWILAAIAIGTMAMIGGSISGYLPAGQVGKEETLATRLKALEDHEEIRQLLMDYGRFLDRRDFAAFSQLFAEKEGEWIGGMGRAKTPDAIRKLMEKNIGVDVRKGGAANYHLFTNEIIQVNGNRASATAKWIFVIQSDAGRPQPFLLGHYEDSLIRENGRWKFLRRVVHGDIPPDSPL